MAQFGRDLLSQTPSFFWIAALAVVLLFHCSHFARMRGESRWYHCAHVVMLLGMLYMFSAAPLGLHFLPPRGWSAVYVATCVAILIWALIELARGRSLNMLWGVAFIQQVAMIYMWVPLRSWLPLLTYGFVLYFAVEIVVWLARAYAKLALGAAVAANGRHAGGALEPRSAFGDICMTVMAASMAYMFVAMQLLAPVAPRPEPWAKNEAARMSEPASTPPRAQPAPPSPEISASRGAMTYEIAAGDTLSGIAAKAYGSARLWERIAEANPGVDPHRLRVGQIIELPAPPPGKK